MPPNVGLVPTEIAAWWRSPLDDNEAGIHAIGRHGVRLVDRHVGGREAEILTAAVAACTTPDTSCGRPSTAAAPGMSPAAMRSRTSVEQRTSDDSRCAPRRARCHAGGQRNAFGGEARSCSGRHQRRDISGGPSAEMEVLPHDDRRGAELAHDDALDELGRGPTGDLAVEGQHPNLVGAVLTQELDAAFQRAQQLRRLVRREQAGRVRVEGHRDDGLAPAAAAAASRCWWPRWTPSKLPIVTTAGSSRGPVATPGMSRQISSRRKANRAMPRRVRAGGAAGAAAIRKPSCRRTGGPIPPPSAPRSCRRPGRTPPSGGLASSGPCTSRLIS